MGVLDNFLLRRDRFQYVFYGKGGGVLSTSPDKQGMTLVCHMKKLGPYYPFHLRSSVARKAKPFSQYSSTFIFLPRSSRFPPFFENVILIQALLLRIGQNIHFISLAKKLIQERKARDYELFMGHLKIILSYHLSRLLY